MLFIEDIKFITSEYILLTKCKIYYLAMHIHHLQMFLTLFYEVS